MSAAELVSDDYEELAPVVDLNSAASGAEIHEGMANNTYFDWELGDEAATDTALKGSHTLVHATLRNNRLVPNAMEHGQPLLNMMISTAMFCIQQPRTRICCGL